MKKFVSLMSVLLIVLMSLALGACDGSTSKVQNVSSGGYMVIPVSELSSSVRFYPVNVDGKRMEVMAAKDSSGRVRTAFNTCKVCYDSGKGYYKQSGNKIVCQNCKNAFTVSDLETSSNGCIPWPIYSSDKTIVNGEVRISYDFLKRSASIFANWKK